MADSEATNIPGEGRRTTVIGRPGREARRAPRAYLPGVPSPASPLPSPAPFRGAPSWGALASGAALRALVSPRLALDLVRAAWAFRRRDWWARAPFLPVPDRTYLRWRMYTAYGSEDAVPPLDDLLRFVRWRRETMGM